MKLGFMTFVLPEWEIERVVKFAKDAGYDGVEIRVDAGHKHELSSQSSAETRQYVKKLFADTGVEIPSVATSVHFACPEPDKRQENIDIAKANLDLAADLGAKVVRIFAGGEIPELDSAAADRVASSFDEVGEYAKGSGACPMLECGHDIVKTAVEGAEVIKRVRTDNFCVLWNHAEMDDQTFELLKSHLGHFHVHDDALDPASPNMQNLVNRMKGFAYEGYFSLEIIKGHNLPEEQLRETAKRIKGYIGQA